MRHLLSLVCLPLVFLSSPAVSKDIEITDQDLKALEILLENAPLLDEDLEFDDEDDVQTKSIWNPVSWIKKKLRNKCKCENHTCQCCFKLKYLDQTACLSLEQLIDTKQLHVKFAINENSLVDQTFSLQRNDQLCGTVPAPFNFLKFCFNQQMDVETDNSITACSSVDFRVNDAVGAVIQFRCLQLKNGTISFGGYKEVEKSQMLIIKAKNPFKAAIAYFKKAIGKI